MKEHRLVAWGLMMVAGSIAAGNGMLARQARPDEAHVVYFWGCGLLVVSGVMFVVDYLRSYRQ
ncbi:MAG: hypothetical protein JNK76_13945 [Planctomycetales bacterium]|nr:hypothetical protein [Planctomycetales bacterium]MBN8624381.1 hypothetical protein [Planctomycetota bacterium]